MNKKLFIFICLEWKKIFFEYRLSYSFLEFASTVLVKLIWSVLSASNGEQCFNLSFLVGQATEINWHSQQFFFFTWMTEKSSEYRDLLNSTCTYYHLRASLKRDKFCYFSSTNVLVSYQSRLSNERFAVR